MTDPLASAITPADRVDYRRMTLLTFGVILGIFATGASIQSVFVLGILPHSMLRGTVLGDTVLGGTAAGGGAGAVLPLDMTLNLVIRLGANAAGIAAGLLGVALLAPQERGPAGRLATGAVIALLSGLARAALQVALGVYAITDLTELGAELATAVVATSISLALALAQTDARRRLRSEERASAAQALRASAALEALQSEELRVRREVADGLHGTVQQRFILLGARLDAVLATLDAAPGTGSPATGSPDTGAREAGLPRAGSPGAGSPATGSPATIAASARELRAIRDDLDSLREQDLRSMSHLLYPARLDHGAVAAVRALFQPLPGTIAVRLEFSPRAVQLEGEGNRCLRPERRLLLVRVVEEALSNALKHGRATDLAFTLDVAGASPPNGSDGSEHFTLVFDDNGIGLPADPRLRGLRSLGDQLETIGGSLRLAPGALGGARVAASVPL